MASLYLEQGVSPKTVAERLGHASVTITLDLYSHCLPGVQDAAAAQFDAAMAAAVPVTSQSTLGSIMAANPKRKDPRYASRVFFVPKIGTPDRIRTDDLHLERVAS